MKERVTVTEVVNTIAEALRVAPATEVVDRARVMAHSNQLVLHHGEREFVVTVVQVRKSRLK